MFLPQPMKRKVPWVLKSPCHFFSPGAHYLGRHLRLELTNKDQVVQQRSVKGYRTGQRKFFGTPSKARICLWFHNCKCGDVHICRQRGKIRFVECCVCGYWLYVFNSDQDYWDTFAVDPEELEEKCESCEDF